MKFLVITFLNLFIFLSAFAQPISYIGIKIGSCFSNINQSGLNTLAYDRISLSGGLAAEFIVEEEKPWLKRVVLMSGVDYAPKGPREYIGRNEAFKELNYLTAYSITKYYIGMMGGYQSGLYVKAGGYGSYLHSAKMPYLEQVYDIKSRYQPYDYGYIVGAGFSMLGIFSADFGYEIGLADVLKELPGVKNRSMHVAVILTYPVNRLKHTKKSLPPRIE